MSRPWRLVGRVSRIGLVGRIGRIARFGARVGARVGAGLALAGATVLVAAAPASAATTVSITSPQDKAVIGTTSTPTLGGDVESDGYVCQIELSVAAKGGQPAPTQTTTIDLTPRGGGSTASRTAQFTWSPTLPANGPFTLTATAHTLPDPFCRLGQEQTAVATRSFALAVPAAPPTGLTATATADRHVDLAWTANAEPDLSAYAVFRVARADKDTACPAPADADRIATVAPAPKPAFTDTFGSADPGGTYCYTVAAERPGADPKKSVVLSQPSPPQETVVAAGTGGGNGPGGGSAGPGAGGSGDPGPSVGGGPAPGGAGAAPSGSGLDLSNLSALQSKAKAAGAAAAKKPRGGLAPLPDGTFDPKLPFKPGETPEDGAGDALAGTTVTRAGGGDHAGQVRAAAAVAASLVVFVVLGHLMLLRREVRRVPVLDAVEP